MHHGTEPRGIEPCGPGDAACITGVSVGRSAFSRHSDEIGAWDKSVVNEVGGGGEGRTTGRRRARLSPVAPPTLPYLKATVALTDSLIELTTSARHACVRRLLLRLCAQRRHLSTMLGGGGAPGRSSAVVCMLWFPRLHLLPTLSSSGGHRSAGNCRHRTGDRLRQQERPCDLKTAVQDAAPSHHAAVTPPSIRHSHSWVCGAYAGMRVCGVRLRRTNWCVQRLHTHGTLKEG